MTQENEVTHSTTNTAAREFTEFTYAEAIAIAQRNMQENCPSVSRVFLARIAELEAALLAKSAEYDALVAGVRDLAAGWSYETANFVHGTNCAENRAMCAQKAACADDLSRLLVREGGDA